MPSFSSALVYRSILVFVLLVLVVSLAWQYQYLSNVSKSRPTPSVGSPAQKYTPPPPHRPIPAKDATRQCNTVSSLGATTPEGFEPQPIDASNAFSPVAAFAAGVDASTGISGIAASRDTESMMAPSNTRYELPNATGTGNATATAAQDAILDQSKYTLTQRLTASDLLPKDAANTKWAKLNPAGQGSVMHGALLNAGHHRGVDTTGQTLRNPNLQLRSEMPNPKRDVGPWNQSTIEADISRRHFELGEQ